MARTVMIVGNGEIAAGLARSIDAADIVMRFNDCRSAGHGGARTDIVAVCNTGRPARKMLHEHGWTDNPAIRSASSIWCVRAPEKFVAMRAPLQLSHPELDDFCDDYTDGFAAFASQTGKVLHVVPAETHERLDRALAPFEPDPYVVPSTGLVAIAEFLWHFRRPGDLVSIAGFSHQGWEWHPWEAEKRWIDSRMSDHELTRLFENEPVRYASGA